MVQTAPMTETQHNKEARVAVTRLDLTQFRNYPSLRLTLPAGGPRLVVLTGENGAGKTNLLEAISYLGPGRGLRGARLTDITHNAGAGVWAVSGVVNSGDQTRQIGCGIEYLNSSGGAVDAGRARRIIAVDGERLSGASQLAPLVSIIWLTPRMDRLFQEGASERRRFYDQLVTGLFPGHAGQISAFEKAMRERLRLLTKHSSGGDEAWLLALERRMAEAATAIAATRLEALDLLKTHLGFKHEGAFPTPVLSLEGEVEELAATLPALEAEEKYAGLLKQTRRADARSGRTTKGVHKTDLGVWHGQKSMPAAQCSTGEQKALLTGIILSSVRLQISLKGRAPILLLDEVAAHLDAARRDALFEEVSLLGVQTWLTGTDPALFAPLKGKATFLQVENGTIEFRH